MSVSLSGRRPVSRDRRAEAHKLSATGGLAALSLDALSSVAYGPEAIVIALSAAGAAAVRLTLPISIAITALLVVLVVSYRQVIAVHPEGGGAYAVAKQSLGRTTSLLAAASLVVDYVLTVAVSLAAGAASLADVFPSLGDHLLTVAIVALVGLTGLNLVGIAESARVLMVPTLVFIVAMLATAGVSIARSHPVATVGHDLGHIQPTEALGIVLVLKAFAAGCSALTGVEAIANAVPSFRAPAVRRAQRTEIGLGVLLGAMLVLLAIAIKVHHVVPRGGVTTLAQLSAGAFGTGWPYYVTNLSVALILVFAANTSFGGLPVLMSLLAKDNRLPHLFGLRAERPVFRVGVVALAVLAAALLLTLGASTQDLLPLFAIGVFIGFTISQVGLVRHYRRERGRRWLARAALSGSGAVLTAAAAVIFMASKFTAGAWLLLIIIPVLMSCFDRVERYYRSVGRALALDRMPDCRDPIVTSLPLVAAAADAPLVVVPVTDVSRRTELALRSADRLGGVVVAVAAAIDPERTKTLCSSWAAWCPGVELTVLPSPHRSLVDPVVGYVTNALREGHPITVLLAEVEPRYRIQEVFHNQRGLVLASALRARTDAIVATVPFRLGRDLEVGAKGTATTISKT